MTSIDLSGKVALITGGTGGIGLASGLELAAAGARTVLTYRWGSTPEDEIRRLFKEQGAPAPLILEADVSREDDTPALMERIAAEHPGVDIFVSNVGFALKAETLELVNPPCPEAESTNSPEQPGKHVLYGSSSSS